MLLSGYHSVRIGMRSQSVTMSFEYLTFSLSDWTTKCTRMLRGQNVDRLDVLVNADLQKY